MLTTRFTLRRLLAAVAATTLLMGMTVLASRQTQRCMLCTKFAELHLAKQRAVLGLVAKMHWYVKEHHRYEMPREAGEAAHMAGWFQNLATYHAGMSRKYRHAAWRPWETLPAEPL